MSFSITVPTSDLRNALTAVAPHADQDPDFPPLHRIRLTVGDDAVNLEVTATNRYTAALALADISDERGDSCPAHVDLSPQDVKEVLALFRAPKGEEGEQPDAQLRLDVDDEHTTITDVSGLFPGKSLTLPRYADETNFPDVAGIAARALRRPFTGELVDRLVTSGRLLGLFGSAAKAYGEPLVLEPTGETSALVIGCGEAFLGLLMPIRQDDEKAAQQGRWREAWLRRLPVIAVEVVDA